MKTQPETRPAHRPQISLALMMFLMLVFALMSAGLFYASRVPVIQDELTVLTGGQASSRADAGRFAQMLFILFTLTSPLLLALTLSVGVAAYRRFAGRRR